MKKPLSQGAIIGSVVAVVIIVVIAAMLFFKPSLSSGPPLTPEPFKPPAGFDPSKAGGPIGAPSDAGSTKTSAG